MSLYERTASAIGWTTSARIAQAAFQFGLSVMLMRLLGPEAFGQIAMVAVITGFAAIFSQFGFSSALVQRTQLAEAHRSSAFWANLALGTALAVLLASLAPLVAAFYHSPELTGLTRWLSVGFVVNAFGMVPRAILQREMRFDMLALVDVATLVLAGGAAVVAAALGAGVWSLVIQALLGGLFTATGLFLLSPWRPALLVSSQALRELLRYGAGLTGFSAINYWARSADNLLIGRFMGPIALGNYTRAYALMLLPITQVIGVLAPAMFPALSTIQNDPERVKRIYLRTGRLIAFLAFPMMFGLFAVAPFFVSGVFGPEWAGVTPLIQILCLVGVLQSLSSPVGLIYTSQGRTNTMFWWGLVASTITILFLVGGVALGSAESVAWCYLAANLLLTIPAIDIPGRFIGMRALDVFRSASGALACSVGMMVVVFGMRLLLPADIAPLAALAGLVLMGAISYAALAWLARLAAVTDLVEALARLGPGARRRLEFVTRVRLATRTRDS